MSPSNIGDLMNYLPQDVLVDLSYTDYNPIKAVYTNYTCDTGQRSGIPTSGECCAGRQ